MSSETSQTDLEQLKQQLRRTQEVLDSRELELEEEQRKVAQRESDYHMVSIEAEVDKLRAMEALRKELGVFLDVRLTMYEYH